MLNLFYLLLMLRVGSTDDLIFEMKTVGVGEDVTLTCTRQKSELRATLFWIRLVSKNLKPEFLGGTFTFDYDGVNQTPRITAKQEPETFLLHISKTELSDTGVYYCMKVINKLNMTFLKRTFLRIKGQEPNITAVIQVPRSDPVHPGDSVTLQCSVLSDSETKTCPGDHRVYWFRAGLNQFHPSVIYVHGNSGDKCEKSLETPALQKCVYNFFMDDVSSSDAGTYHCAVATCGEILFSNGTKLNIEVVSALDMWDLQKANTVVCLLCAALAISLIVISFLIYAVKKKSCGCSNATVVLETNAAAASGDHHSRQRGEDSLTYSAPTFTKRKAGKQRRTAEGETVYSDIHTFAID